MAHFTVILLFIVQSNHYYCYYIQIYTFKSSTEGEKPETKQKRLEAKYAALQIVPNIEKLGTAKVRYFRQSKIRRFQTFLSCSKQ